MKKIDKNFASRQQTYFLLALLVVGICSLFLVTMGDKLIPVKKPNLKEAKSESDNKNLILPFPLESQAVSSILLLYFFQAPVKDYLKTEEGYQIVLDTTAKDLPKFIVTDKSRILQLVEGTDVESNESPPATTVATSDDIKPGQLVQIGANYDLRTKLWKVAGVTILSQ